MTPEGKVKAEVRKVMHELGIYTFPVNQQGIGRRGIPDDYACWRGVPMFIEYKASIRWDKNNKTAVATMPTPLQIIEMTAARAQGMRTYVIDCNNKKDFIKCLQAGKEYDHPWLITMDEYEWYRSASPEFFENHILREVWAQFTLGFMPYETIVTMAKRFNYGYRFMD